MPGDPLIGTKLGDYLIQSKLGQGGMATVYKGYDENLERYAAVKVIHIGNVADEDVPEYRERFSREARAIARLNHPGIVGVYQFGMVSETDLYYMAMVFIEGRDLRQILKEYSKRGKRMSNAQIMRIVRDIAHALDYAHQQGVIHRDIKPSNIMVNEEGHAVLTDFGLAMNTQEGTFGNTFGSVHYIAPEQAVNSAQATGQSDLYSLGVVLFEMLAGRVPFDDDSAMSVALKHISHPPPRPSELNADVPPLVEDVVMKALYKEPERRYANGAVFVQALETAFASSDDDDTHDLDAPSRPITPLPIPAVLQTSENTPPQKSTREVSSESVARAQQTQGSSTTPINRPPTADRPSQVWRPGRASLRDEDENPTLATDPSRPSRVKALPSHAGRSGGLWIAALVLILLLVVGGGVLLFASGALTPDPEPTAPVVAAVEGTATDAPTEAPSATAPSATEEAAAVGDAITAEATDAPTDEPTEAPTATDEPTEAPSATVPAATDEPTEAATVTDEPTEPPTEASTATDEPTEAPSATVLAATATPGLTAAEGEAAILLRYDGRTLVLFNRSARSVYIGDLDFVQTTASGEIVYEASEWLGTNVNAPTEVCFQIWSTVYRNLPDDEFPADICRSRRGFGQTSREFWLSDNPDATFEVRRGSNVLATCPAVLPVTEVIPGDPANPYQHCAVALPARN